MNKFYFSGNLLLAAALLFGASSAMAQSSAETFEQHFNNCNGTGGNDDLIGGGDVQGEAITDDNISTFLDAAQDGWNVKDYVAEANGCVRIATGKKPGAITTPEVGITDLHDQEGSTLTFNAVAWAGDKVTLSLDMVGKNDEDKSEIDKGTNVTFEYPGKNDTKGNINIAIPTDSDFTTQGNSKIAKTKDLLKKSTYVVFINGLKKTSQIKFSSKAKNRIFLDEIKIVKGKVGEAGGPFDLTGTSTGVSGIAASKAVKSVVYTDLSGRTISEPESGFYVKTVRYTDGSISSSKLVK